MCPLQHKLQRSAWTRDNATLAFTALAAITLEHITQQPQPTGQTHHDFPEKKHVLYYVRLLI